MSKQVNGVRKSFIQETAVNPFRIVKLGTGADEVAQAAANTDIQIGVAAEQTNPLAGDAVDVVLTGTVKVQVATPLAKGKRVTSDANGKAVDSAGTENVEVVGYLLETTTVNDQIAEMLLVPATNV